MGVAGKKGICNLQILRNDIAASCQQFRAMPQGRNWLALPDGLCVEVMQASAPAVGQALAIDPRA